MDFKLFLAQQNAMVAEGLSASWSPPFATSTNNLGSERAMLHRIFGEWPEAHQIKAVALLRTMGFKRLCA